jgi:phosphopantetheinyl transferase
MNSVYLYYLTHNGETDLAQVKDMVVNQWLSDLAINKQAKVKRLINRNNRVTSLLATRLLLLCARHAGIKDFRLQDIHYPEHGKPGWYSEAGIFFDFNITHSGNIIMLAASTTSTVGVDAEQIRELKNLNFKMVLSTDELAEIQLTPELFFELWSKKEAVVKAANTTGLARMRDVILKNSCAILDDRRWYLNNIDPGNRAGEQYAIHLASSQPVDEMKIKQLTISELL